MSSVRVFFLGGLTSYRALFGWLSPWVFVPALLVAPVFQILLFVYVGRSAGVASDAFYVVGNALQYASIPCLFAATHTVAGERAQQTLPFILISPALRLPLFVGRSLPVIVNGFFVAAFALVCGSALVGVAIPGHAYAPMAVVAIVSAAACTGLGLAIAALGLVVRNTAVLANMVFGVLLVGSGANVARDDLPGWMQAISERLPLTHGIAAAREVAGGNALRDVAGLIGSEAIVGAAFACVGYLLIRVLETLSRRRGTLERA